MVPSPATVMRLRFAVRLGVRLAAVAWAVVFLVALYRTYHAVLGYELGFGGYNWPKGGPNFPFSLMVTCLTHVPVLAVILLSERWLARWLVPLPAAGCVRCGYSLEGIADGRCPECGQGDAQA